MGPNGARPTSPARVGNPQRRRASTWVMVALTLLGLVAVIALGTGLYLTSRTQTTKVPDVVGKNVSRRRASSRQHSLNLGSPASGDQQHVHARARSSTPRPTRARRCRSTRTVRLNVCAGPGTTLVPQIDRADPGRRDESAQPRRPHRVSFQQVDVREGGIVLSASPGENTSSQGHSTVIVKISQGQRGQDSDGHVDAETEAPRS